MNADDLRAFVWDLRVWTRGWDRAPHKAFTLIAALEHLRRERPGMASWCMLRTHVKELLDEYSTCAAAAAHYPVWRLSSDDDSIWQVTAAHDELGRRIGEPPGPARRSGGVHG